MISMKTEKSVEVLYQTMKSKFGRSEARQTVSAVLGNILDDIEEEGIVVSEEEVSRRLAKVTQEFVEAAKADVA
jgi:hypothetical protein